MEKMIDLLTNRREQIVDELMSKYHYQYLWSVFDQINNRFGLDYLITPTDRYVYRLLSSTYHKNKYPNAAIHYVPSLELVEGLLAIASYFGIKSIEEIYAGLGLLSALMTRLSDLNIVASDPLTDPSTSNQLGLIDVARRSIDDFQYYDKMSEPYPEMLISSYYPPQDICSCTEPIKSDTTTYLKKLTERIRSENHTIIAIILPNIVTQIYDIFYHDLAKSYVVYTYHIKAIDKYFHIAKLTEKYYPNTMLLHLLIKKTVLADHHSQLVNLCQPFILPVTMIDTHCRVLKSLYCYYNYFSYHLLRNLFAEINMQQSYLDEKLVNIQIYLRDINRMGFRSAIVPQFLITIEEFYIWALCFTNKMYLWFSDRIQFLAFYYQTQTANIHLPQWIRSTKMEMYKYFYLWTVNASGNWKNSSYQFTKVWSNINMANKDKYLAAVSG